jgi:hypothetical protein
MMGVTSEGRGHDLGKLHLRTGMRDAWMRSREIVTCAATSCPV